MNFLPLRRVLAAVVAVTMLSLESVAGDLHVGAAASDLVAEDTMVIAGGITEGRASGQEGKLRCTSVMLEKDGAKVAIITCDVLMLPRSVLDPVQSEIARETGIPESHILINCTHTHHAPSTLKLHGYVADEDFTRRVQRAIVDSAREANRRLATNSCRFYFGLGEERTVGQNSRQLLDDGQIYWIGPRTNFVRPTGPFDPELPVLAFRNQRDQWSAVIFNHSTHTIGTREPGKRSPSFYGLAAQDIEWQLGATVAFLEGASGSTHNLELTGAECTGRIRESVRETLNRAQPMEVARIDARKRPFQFRVRRFDEAAEEMTVKRYCRKYAPSHAEVFEAVFRNMRRELAPIQGEERETWIQAVRIGDVAIVGVPAEYFTQLGLDIKNRSPFRYTYVAELANDWIGYLPNLEAHKLGGYQVWTGFHSYAEPGTGERIADAVVALLQELKN